jgi:hypothetical protein
VLSPFRNSVGRGAILKRERARIGVVGGDGWIFAGQRFGWHSCRRAFCNELRDVNLRDLKDPGGWKSERTIVSADLQPSGDAQRAALHRRTGDGAPAVTALREAK